MSIPLNELQASPLENRIFIIRDQKVMLDSDLAMIYGVETKRLNEQVKRNSERFPTEFMFQLTADEFDFLRSQNATLENIESLWSQNATLEVNRGKHRKYLPYVFTEHGTVMLASVLKSQTAVEASIQIVKAFVKFKEIISSQAVLASKIEELESKYDNQFKQVFDAIRQLMVHSPEITTIKKGRKD
jgi:phage regulator Rha-like protein